MKTHIGTIVLGVENIERAVEFWSQVLDYKLAYPIEHDWASIVPKEGDGVKLLFQLEDPVSEPRHHLDLYTSNRHEEVNRILKLGATIPEWDYPDDANWTVLVDTEGNPFCLADR